MRILRRMLNMCDLAYEVTARSIILCCVMLFSAFMLLVDAGGYTAATYSTYRLAQELAAAPQWILLLSVLGAAVIEDRCGS